MPQASSFTNKVRADTEGRNTKVEYPGSIMFTKPLGALMCTDFMNPTTGLYQPPWWVPTKYKRVCLPKIGVPFDP